MCGIAGYIALNDFNGEKALASQHHRGPDDNGTYREELAGKNICLQHTRLSIIDLSNAGHQPMVTDDKTCVISFNGEIYNYLDLKNEFLADIKFHSRTDTEVILNLYHRLGIGFLKKLNGDFAISILDRRLNKLFLARDHFGVKPLYYLKKGDNLFFGSEIKAILNFGITPELDKYGIENYLVFKYSPDNTTLFKDINALPPAHYLEVDISSGTTRINRYWELARKSATDSYKECKEELYNLMQDAVRIRLMSDVPVGTFFSGGIDSSIIASFLKDHPQITHYTARKTKADLAREGTTSDYYFADRLAKNWGLKMVPVNINSKKANLDLINASVFFGDDLIADGSQIPSYLITREARKSSVVILSGMGADEIFCGYKSHYMALIADKLDHFPDPFKNTFIKILANLNQGKGFFKSYRRHLRQFGKYNSKGKIKYGFFGVVGDYENAVSLLKSPMNTALTIFQKYFDNEADVFENIFRFERENFLVKNLHYTDRMCMANSMEGRVPFLDHRIAEFAFNLPVKFKISNTGRSKLILKDTFKDILPEELIRRRKAGFGMPLRSIFSSEQKVYSLLDIDFFCDFGIFIPEKIKQAVRNHSSGIEDNASLIYSLISFQQWYKMWFEGGFRKPAPCMEGLN